MRDGIPVLRPLRKGEFEIFFVSKRVQKDWLDLLAFRRNQVVDAWDTLASTPCQTTRLNYQLQGSLSVIIKSGVEYSLWQLKLNERDGSRIWYFMDDNHVYIEEIHTSHPNQTK